MNRYRLWLLAYPRDYRRRHGLELLTTLMDAGPTRADLFDLVRGGVRQRFRLPVGRWMLVLAVLATLCGGTLGAAAGTKAGWLAVMPAMPGDAEVLRLSEVAADMPLPGHAHVLRDSDSGVPEVFPSTVLEPPRVDVRAAATRVAAEGWDVGPIRFEGRDAGFTAERDGVLLDYAASENTWVHVTFTPATPWVWWVFVALGAAVAAVGAWLFTAWAAYRVRRAAQPWRATGAVAAVGTLAGLALPALSVLAAVAEDLKPDRTRLRVSHLIWEIAFSGPPNYLLLASVPLLAASLIAARRRPARPVAATD